MKNRFFENENIPPEILDFTKWIEALPDSLGDSERAKYYRRKDAVQMYIQKASIEEIKQKTGICRDEVDRYTRRCLELDENGQLWGYRALLSRKRINNYHRTEPLRTGAKLTGAFQTLLETYPKIQELIVQLYFNKEKRKPTEPIMKAKYIWKRFLNACRDEGINAMSYPFNTLDQGKRAIERYLKTLDNTSFAKASRRHGGEEAFAHSMATGTGAEKNSKPIGKRPFETVEFDGHRIDLFCIIEYKTPDGDVITKVLERFWILAIIDVASRVILGYYVSFNKEYSAVDVMKCIENAITPWKPKTFTIPKLEYKSGAGFPSGIIPETQWVAWDEFKIDNGMANIANIVTERLSRIVDCAVCPGPVKTPERRPLIERFFGILEENGFHRLPSTTGHSHKDPRRNNPEEKAIKFRISYEHILELIEVLIANYNAEPHQGVYYQTPLDVIRQRITPELLRKIPEEKRAELNFMNMKVTRRVCGNVKTGKRPYINYEGVTYTNSVLANSADLIGKSLTLIVNIDDIRSVRAFLPDGSELGYLIAHDKWGISPHSLKTRQEINKLRQRKLLQFSSQDDPIQIYTDFLAQSERTTKPSGKKLAKKKSSANKLVKLKNEANISSNIVEKNQNDNQKQSVEEKPLYITKAETNNVTSLRRKKPENGPMKYRKTIIY